MADVFNNVTDPYNLNFPELKPILGIFLNVMMGSSAAIALIAVVVSGIQFIMAQGDPKAIMTAQRYLTFAVIAMIITIMGFAIKIILLNLLGATGNVTHDVPNI